MSCDDGNPLLNALLGFFKFLGDPIGTIMNMVADFVLSAAITVFGALAGTVPTFKDDGPAKDINSESQWIVVYLAIGSLIFAAIRMAVERRGDAGITALKGIMRVVLVSGGATTVVMAAAGLSERYSSYLFAAGAQKQLDSIGQCNDGGSITAFLLIVLAFLLLIAGIIHTVLLYIRLGVMTLLLGTLPLAAAASMTNWGGGWWRKHLGWMVAWLLYKPAAALVLYGGTAMITASSNGKNSDVSTRIAGIGVMLLSAVALPALLKLVMPATAALGGGNAMSGAMSAAGGALATGARSLGGALDGKGDSGGGGSGGRQGPSGASGTGGGTGGTGAGGSNGSNGGGGSAGGVGKAGSMSGGSGGPGGGGMGGGGMGGGGGGASGALKAAGPVGMAVEAGITAAKIVTKAASGSIEGADGNAGHNQ